MVRLVTMAMPVLLERQFNAVRHAAAGRPWLVVESSPLPFLLIPTPLATILLPPSPGLPPMPPLARFLLVAGQELPAQDQQVISSLILTTWPAVAVREVVAALM